MQQRKLLEIEADDRRVEEERARELCELSRQAGDRYGTPDRSWCQPTKHNRVVGVDFGSGKIAVAVAGELVEDAKEFSTLAEVAGFLAAGDLVVGESAHLASPRRKDTPAQMFTEEELLAFYRECDAAGATLRLLPQEHTFVMRSWAATNFPEVIEEGKDTDANDAAAFAYYVRHCNDFSLARPQTTLSGKSRKRLFGAEVRLRANAALNLARSSIGYDGLPVVGEVAVRVAERMPSDNLWFSRYYKGKQNGEMNMKFIASIVATIVGTRELADDETPVIFAAGGHAPGKNSHSQFVLRMTPFHRKAGVTRSNLVYHRWRHAFADFAKHFNDSVVKTGSSFRKHAEFTPEEKLAKKAAWRAFRDEVALIYRLTHEVAEELGFERHDII